MKLKQKQQFIMMQKIILRINKHNCTKIYSYSQHFSHIKYIQKTPIYYYSQSQPNLRKQETQKVELINEKEFLRKIQIEPFIDLQQTELEQELQQRKKKILAKKKNSQNIIIIKKKHTILDSIKHMVQLLRKSFYDIYLDTKYIIKLRMQKKLIKNYSLVEYISYRQITYDLFKFVPYSVFLLIPFLEIFLPVYMVLFPNSLPSQFFTEKTIGETNRKFQKTQIEGLKVLEKKLYSVFKEDYSVIQTLNKQLNLNSDDIKLKMKLKMYDEELTKKILKNWKQYENELGYNNLTLEEKEAFLKLFYIEYINGRNLINIFVNIPKTIYKYGYKIFFAKYPEIQYYDLKLDFFPLKQIQSILLTLQLKYHLRRIQYEDILLQKELQEQLKKFKSSDSFKIVRKRGFNMISEQDNLKFLQKDWLKLTNKTQIRKDEFLWIVVLKHRYLSHLIQLKI